MGNGERESPLVGRTFAGRYRIEKELGAGGMGTAFLARDTNVERPVVVKVPHSGLLVDPAFRERFSREIRSLVAAEHRAIVSVIDVGEEDGLPFVVLRYLPGGNLKERIRGGGGRQAPDEVLRWLPTAARALDALHQRGMLHRDVKPANILFDGDDAVYLADFGIAKVLGATASRLTTTGAVPGTPEYMGPEVMTDNALGPRYDQYALAATVYEALAGGLPHSAHTPLALLASKATKPPRPLAEAAPHVPGPVAATVMRALATDPDDRFERCAEFADAFAVAQRHPAAVQRPRLAVPATRQVAESRPARERAAPAWRRKAALLVLLAAAAATWFASMGRGNGSDSPTATRKDGRADGRKTEPEVEPTARRPELTLTLRGVRNATEGVFFSYSATVHNGGGAPAFDAVLDVLLPEGAEYGSSAGGELRGSTVSWNVGRLAGGANRDMTFSVSLKEGAATFGAVCRASNAEAAWASLSTETSRAPREATRVPGAEVLRTEPDPEIITDPGIRARIEATGWPWLIRDRLSGIEFVLIPPGTFQMGATPDDEHAHDSEKPRREVEVTQPFYAARTEVTQEQWRRVTDSAPSHFRGARLPVEQVSWEDCDSFCRKLDTGVGLALHRLPTEAEWEYMCRAGAATRYWSGDKEAALARAGWYAANSGGRTRDVGLRPANGFGLHDVHGNVWEWCQDWFDPVSYAKSPRGDPVGPETGTTRVLRGGCFSYGAKDCRAPGRVWGVPTLRHRDGGLRPVRVTGQRALADRDDGVDAILSTITDPGPNDEQKLGRLREWMAAKANHKHVESVVHELERLTVANPRDADLQVVLATALVGKLSYDTAAGPQQSVVWTRAARAYDAAIAIAPNHWHARFGKAYGTSLFPEFMGMRPAAIRQFEELRTIQERLPSESHFARTYFQLARLYRAAGDSERARAILAAGHDRFPDDADIRAGLPKAEPLPGAVVLREKPDPAVITDPKIRARIEATGGPWLIRDERSGIEFVLIPPGTFWMGASPEDGDAGADEKPRHEVEITKPFYLARTEVTGEQWNRALGVNRPTKGADLPVDMVHWTDCESFCRDLNRGAGRPVYRLPTEAEWEYACRAGTTTRYWPGDRESDLAKVGWYAEIADKTHQVGQKPANGFGLHDVHGNVLEWCRDWYDSGYYAKRPGRDPEGPEKGERRVLRGGSCFRGAQHCRASVRATREHSLRERDFGFRPARVTTPPSGRPMVTLRFTGPRTGIAGDSLAYTVLLTNSDTAPMADVALVITLPAGAAYDAAAGGARQGDVVTWKLGSLMAGASREVKFRVRLKAGTATLRAKCRAAGSEEAQTSWRTEVEVATTSRKLPGAEVLREKPDPSVIKNAKIRARIEATGWPWLIRDQKSGIEFVLIPPGTFWMGLSPGDDSKHTDDEKPRHEVQLTKAFYLARTEVTQEQWKRVTGKEPSLFESATRPVERVSWEDCESFCMELNRGVGLPLYRLPTEAQWEYACRAGTETRYWSGDRESDFTRVGWCTANAGRRTQDVGLKPANGFGLFDVHGNVYEWCRDWYDSSYYLKSPKRDPQGPESGTSRVMRGGGFPYHAITCRSSARSRSKASRGLVFTGFRPARITTE